MIQDGSIGDGSKFAVMWAASMSARDAIGIFHFQENDSFALGYLNIIEFAAALRLVWHGVTVRADHKPTLGTDIGFEAFNA